MQTNALILPSRGWQVASRRDISSSLAPCHLPTNPHPRTKVKWPVPFETLTIERRNVSPRGSWFLWVRSKRAIHILFRLKRLIHMLVHKSFNQVRQHGLSSDVSSINSDSKTHLLLPDQLEAIFSFCSRFLSLMVMMMMITNKIALQCCIIIKRGCSEK